MQCYQYLSFCVYRYDLVFGVATADALVFGLNDKQLEYGVELEGRNQILSEFVSANYELHQREIFSAIVTEYTDWQSPTHHPASIRDKTLEALNDAEYVAPLVEVILTPNTLFYCLWMCVPFLHNVLSVSYVRRIYD